MNALRVRRRRNISPVGYVGDIGLPFIFQVSLMLMNKPPTLLGGQNAKGARLLCNNTLAVQSKRPCFFTLHSSVHPHLPKLSSKYSLSSYRMYTESGDCKHERSSRF